MSESVNARAMLLAIGKAQVDAMFARQMTATMIDDSEFLPLLESVLAAFEGHDTGRAAAAELWAYAFSVYDRICRESDPESTFEENQALMQSYLKKSRASYMRG